jgi:hypothetical protein
VPAVVVLAAAAAVLVPAIPCVCSVHVYMCDEQCRLAEVLAERLVAAWHSSSNAGVTQQWWLVLEQALSTVH